MTSRKSTGRSHRPGTQVWRAGSGLAAGLGVLALCVSGGAAHEQNHTHAGLAEAAFEVLDHPRLRADDADVNALANLVQGVKDEDLCPNYYSHFFNPKTDKNTISAPRFDPNCGARVDARKGKTRAPNRAGILWDRAVRQYDKGDRRGAYHTLGQVLHLLQDMTSPSHVHNNPHGKLLRTCSQDDDDFENWGWCKANGTRHIRDYWDDRKPVVSDRMTVRLETALERLFGGQPRFVTPDPGRNVASAYVRHVANIVYNFTTFRVVLVDKKIRLDRQPDSELKRMFPDLKEDPLGGWRIGLKRGGPNRLLDNIGHTQGECGRSERGADIREEWWPMENPDGSEDVEDGSQCKIKRNRIGQKLRVKARAFIENAGGEGDRGRGVRDSLVPLKYEKGQYQTLYGTRRNTRNELNKDDGDTGCPANFNRNPAAHDDDDDCPKTMLRIYGDVLYPIAVVYGAGLLREFVDAVNRPPVADAGADRVVECSGPAGAQVVLDGSGSSDPDGDPLTYSWTNDFGEASGVNPAVTLGLGVHPITLVVNDGQADSEADMVRIEVVDTTPPDVIASLTLIGARDDDSNDDEGRFKADFSAADVCDPAPSVTAVLSAPGCPDIAVSDGQIFEFEHEDDECKVKSKGGIYEIEAPSLTLRVTANDTSGNVATAEDRTAGLGDRHDDDRDDGVAGGDDDILASADDDEG